ncbi:MAG: hypothetical protein HYY06_24345 [Deltaproteobacteria bacterium]|nr:hypothetical protein [Deltaproteobacteria bacterium]
MIGALPAWASRFRVALPLRLPPRASLVWSAIAAGVPPSLAEALAGHRRDVAATGLVLAGVALLAAGAGLL